MHLPGRPRLVVVGGGFGGLEAAFYLQQRLRDRAEVELISDTATFVYKPDTIYIPFGLDPDTLRVPLEAPARRRGIVFIRSKVLEVDPERQTVRAGDRIIGYDRLVLATGARNRVHGVAGLTAAAIPLGTIDAMLELRGRLEQVIDDAQAGKRSNVVFLVPPGRRWSSPLYELSWMLDTYLRRLGLRDHVDIKLLTPEASFVESLGQRMDDVADGEFLVRGITAIRNFHVAGVEPGRIVSETRDWAPFDLLVTFPPSEPAAHFAALPMDEHGFLRTVAATRQLQGFDNIYAVGDAADFPLKQAYLAATQADTAAEHIAAGLLGEPLPEAFDPKAVCILDQLDRAAFAQAPLHFPPAENPDAVVVADDDGEYRVGEAPMLRIGRRTVGTLLPRRFAAGKPAHTGLTGLIFETGRKVLSRTVAH
jgi:sulfide:quinone oxidoreductase